MLAPGEVATPISSERFQFQIKHMLIGTFVFAIALSPLRVLLPETKLEYGARDGEMFIVIGVAIAVKLIATLPCLWGGFLSTARAVALGFGWLLYCLVVTGLELATLFMVLRGSGSKVWEVFWLAYLVNVSQCAVVFGVMRCYRALGYRLQRVPRKLPPPLPEALKQALKEAAEIENDHATTPAGLPDVEPP